MSAVWFACGDYLATMLKDSVRLQQNRTRRNKNLSTELTGEGRK